LRLYSFTQFFYFTFNQLILLAIIGDKCEEIRQIKRKWLFAVLTSLSFNLTPYLLYMAMVIVILIDIRHLLTPCLTLSPDPSSRRTLRPHFESIFKPKIKQLFCVFRFTFTQLKKNNRVELIYVKIIFISYNFDDFKIEFYTKI
jgi:hypothetical protein